MPASLIVYQICLPYVSDLIVRLSLVIKSDNNDSVERRFLESEMVLLDAEKLMRLLFVWFYAFNRAYMIKNGFSGIFKHLGKYIYFSFLQREC